MKMYWLCSECHLITKNLLMLLLSISESSLQQALEPNPGPSGLQTKNTVPTPAEHQASESFPGPSGLQTTARESNPGPSGIHATARKSIPGPSGIHVTARESIRGPSWIHATAIESILGPAGQQEMFTRRQDSLLTQGNFCFMDRRQGQFDKCCRVFTNCTILFHPFCLVIVQPVN